MTGSGQLGFARMAFEEREHLWPRLVVGTLTAVAAGFAFFHIGAKSFWQDEAVSDMYARQGLVQLWHTAVHTDPNMSLYYLILHVWIRLGLGESESALRSLSAIFAVLTVPMVYVLGTRLFGRTAGLLAALLLTVNGFVIQYAQEARSYSLVLFLATVSSYFFARELERPSLRIQIGYVATAVLAVYAHYFAALVIAAQLATVLMVRRSALNRRWALIFGVIVALCLPEAVLAVRIGHNSQLGWLQQPTAHDLWRGLVDLSGGHWFLLAVALAGGVLLAVAPVRARRERWQFAFVAAWLLVPLLLSFAASYLETLFYVRYLIVSIPALTLLAAAGIAEIRSRAAAIAIVTAAVFFSVDQFDRVYALNTKFDFRNASRYIFDQARPGDGAIYVSTGQQVPFDYYYARHEGVSAPMTLRAVDATSARNERIWVALVNVQAGSGAPELERALAVRYRRSRTASFRGIEIHLFVRRGSTAASL